MVIQHHPTGASLCPGATACVGSAVIGPGTVSALKGGLEQSSQMLISLQLVLGRLGFSSLVAQVCWVSKVSSGGHVGDPITHTACLEV